MESLTNNMSKQVHSLPALYREQYIDLEPKTRKLLSTPEIFSVQEILITGCGDSFAAGVATKHIFELLTGIPTRVVTAIELSRFYDSSQLGTSPNNPLIFCISHSGNVARMEEATLRANKYGALTIGVTGNLDSKLGQAAQKVLHMETPKLNDAPGVRGYGVTLMALLLMAIRMGEVRGRYTMDVAMSYREDIAIISDRLQENLLEIDKQMKELANEWQNFSTFDFIGSGFDYAAAWYGYAKILEATGDAAMHINTEEWLHLNFFARNNEGIGTILVSNESNPALSRTNEVIEYIKQLKRPFLLINDEIREGVNTLVVPKGDHEFTVILTQFVPIALLASYLSVLKKEEYGRNCEGPWSFSQQGHAVTTSQVIIK